MNSNNIFVGESGTKNKQRRIQVILRMYTLWLYEFQVGSVLHSRFEIYSVQFSQNEERKKKKKKKKKKDRKKSDRKIRFEQHYHFFPPVS